MLPEEQKLIVEKAAILFKKYGIKSVSMDDIANELGMSKKTIYQSVKDKEQLIELFLSEEFLFFKNQFQEIETEALDAIQEFLAIDQKLNTFIFEMSLPLYFDLHKYFPDIYTKYTERYNNLFYEILKGNLEKGKREKIFRHDLPIDIIIKQQLLRIERMPESQIFSRKELASAVFIRELCYYHLRGIINSDAYELLEKYKIEEINKIQSYEPSHG